MMIVSRLMSLIRRSRDASSHSSMETRFVDCRDRDAYLAGHIPGAAHADPERDLTGTGRRRAASTSDGRRLRRVGVRGGNRIGDARRRLRRGHRLGRTALVAPAPLRPRPRRGDRPRRAGTGRFAPARRRSRRPSSWPAREATTPRTPSELLARLGDPGLVLLDARAPERYRGEVEPIDRIAGRIPGARNLPFTETSTLPAELLEAPELVVYCGSGVTACVNVLALTLAGRDDVRLYPGSWSEWSELGNPVERG